MNHVTNKKLCDQYLSGVVGSVGQHINQISFICPPALNRFTENYRILVEIYNVWFYDGGSPEVEE